MMTSHNDSEIDLLELLQIFYSQKWLIIGITAITTFITFVASLLIPKTYKVEATFEIPLHVIKFTELSEAFKSYQKYNRSRIPFNVKISQIKDVQNGGKMEVEGRSSEEAKKNLELIIKIINNEIFRERISDIKEKLEKRLISINRSINDLNTRSGIIYEPSRLADLMSEKGYIEKWFENPQVIRLFDIIASSEPVKPKPVLYTAVGFVSGFFLGIFLALFRHALESRSKELA